MVGMAPGAAQTAGLHLEALPGCQSGLGRVRGSWSFNPTTSVRILVGEQMAPFTGLEAASGSAETGQWVPRA